MAINPLLILGGAAIAAVAYSKRKKKTTTPSTSGGASTNQIGYSLDCSWQIPDGWYTSVGAPRFRQVLDAQLAKLSANPSWEQKAWWIGNMTPLELRYMAEQILAGQTSAACPLPPASMNLQNPPPTITDAQLRMIGLVNQIMGDLRNSLKAFVASNGATYLFPVPPDRWSEFGI